MTNIVECGWIGLDYKNRIKLDDQSGLNAIETEQEWDSIKLVGLSVLCTSSTLSV